VRDHRRVATTAVFFDIGGVLESNPRTAWQAKWAERLGVELSTFSGKLDPIWRDGSIGAITLEDVEDRTAAALGLDAAGVAEMMEDAWAEYLGALNEPLAVYFAGLRPRYMTGMISNSFVGARERERHAYDLESMCDVIVYSHETGWIKPDPLIYGFACQRLCVPPQMAVFVDDVQANVDGARELGLQAIKFENNDQAIAELEALFVAA
jgi:putative hydrolase of the HAD superfamily